MHGNYDVILCTMCHLTTCLLLFQTATLEVQGEKRGKMQQSFNYEDESSHFQTVSSGRDSSC